MCNGWEIGVPAFKGQRAELKKPTHAKVLVSLLLRSADDRLQTAVSAAASAHAFRALTSFQVRGMAPCFSRDQSRAADYHRQAAGRNPLKYLHGLKCPK